MLSLADVHVLTGLISYQKAFFFLCQKIKLLKLGSDLNKRILVNFFFEVNSLEVFKAEIQPSSAGSELKRLTGAETFY